MTRDELTDLQPGAVVVHTKSGVLYDYRGRAKHKDAATRQWLATVVYRALEDGGETYTREVEDFLGAFHVLRIG